ncbi:aminotransferase class V-fold PLP-dependent enzyme [Subsaximicrobium wynnwilliamsii]|uniref:Aminotransferase class V-fold PLP-dependent enzyme n=1 Tax=Subsaximicrobium wynnwilliamsii TaxID=291179 RepID=A0A5C6ZEF0_9FLAO|nr:aminotransferase class V-fold PLP-dependent enzyme [Subsaximicrobium wynnwilliamsii]TXD81833.1 aminotransferase class V-fold PLP-dependent enzyme [Subsaximicrobium wynnwilliamsii]TXD87502.1 aminotransferase class V-fold PLP-dependent enzyme [Subsaximicrobium wynnwilliamsii]TXE01185.1 aminotransferase class V-fold PLP-dependent enzyme [Subsaximicrobium wynnwilliamsii]
MLNDLKLFQELTEILLTEERETPVAKPIPSQHLYDSIDLSLPEDASIDNDFKATLTELIKRTPKTASTSFFNQLFGGRISRATLGDLLAVMLNNSMYTYKVAGPQVGVEKVLLRKICDMIGYTATSDGTFAPGGSMSNFMAVLMARDKYNPEAKTEGMSHKMTLYTSECSHYSIAKNAAFIGVGRNQVKAIKVNAVGEMIPSELDLQIKKDIAANLQPFFVNATAGTTVLGAFDDVEAISKVCKAHDLWLHLDGAYCGSVIFSDAYKHLVKGIALTDSFSVNAHKMLGTPLSCSIIVAKDKKHLYQSFSNDAEYLYQTNDDDYNLGKTSIQCGRRNDALKLWTLWKSVGSKGLEKIVAHQFMIADVARKYIKNHPDYTLYSFDDSISVCFNYKDIPAKTLCTQLYEQAALMVGFGKFKEQEFVRLVTINSLIQEQDMIAFFKTIEAFEFENKPENKELVGNSQVIDEE